MVAFWPKVAGECCCTSAEPGVCGRKAFVLVSACARPGTPIMGTVHMQDGAAAGASELQSITFGGTITGGTFQLDYFATTPSIAWSSNNATLAANVQAGLIATTSFAPGDLTVTPHPDMVGGIGKLLVQFGGAYANFDVVGTIGLASNGLTGPGTKTIAFAQVTPGYASRNAVQAVYFGGTVTGGTFKLAWDGQTTASITWSSDIATLASRIDSALEALSNVGAGNVSVPAPGSGTASSGAWNVTFTGTLAAAPRPLITVAENSLTGTSHFVPLAGVTVTLDKPGVFTSEGVTDAAGLVSMPVYEEGIGYTVSLDGGNLDDFYDHSPYTQASSINCGTNSPLETKQLVPRFSPVLWHSGIARTFAVTGTGGTALGWSESVTLTFVGTAPNDYQAIVEMPNGDGGTNSYTYPDPPAGTRHISTALTCGFTSVGFGTGTL